MTRSTLVLMLAGIGIATFLLARGTPPQVDEPLSLRLQEAAGSPPFEAALEPLEFESPRDHGPHFEFQTEWWYYTGNLQAENGDRFGYQLTIFRRGLSPGLAQRESSLGTNQIYFAHLALTDLSAGEHRAFERFSRGSDGLAGATGDPYRIHLEDWSVEALDRTASLVRLRAGEADIGFDLRLVAGQPLVPKGPGGLSGKGSVPGNASYYFSFTELRTEGTLRVRGRELKVHGSSWFDHEWGTTALAAGAVGWDWFGLQLDDGRELMLYQIRQEQGVLLGGGTLVTQAGAPVWLSEADFQIQALGTWKSEVSGSEYPSGWRIDIPSAGLALEVQPLIADQEMRLGIVYWEGAVRVSGNVSGRGYVELTGYVTSLQGLF